jgi:hypothetical protein
MWSIGWDDREVYAAPTSIAEFQVNQSKKPLEQI